jgi:hypothetical protein
MMLSKLQCDAQPQAGVARRGLSFSLSSQVILTSVSSILASEHLSSMLRELAVLLSVARRNRHDLFVQPFSAHCHTRRLFLSASPIF